MAKKHSLPETLFGGTIIPRYIPVHYRLFLLFSKSYRSVKKRFAPRDAAGGVIEDPPAPRGNVLELGVRREPLVNKTISRLEEDLRAERVMSFVERINGLKRVLDEKGLRYTTPAGTFKSKDSNPSNERTKMWENAWVLANSAVKPGDVVLDIGGASTIFSYFLASMGCEVHVVDNDWGNHGIVYNARYVSKRMNWPMVVHRRDLTERLPFADGFFDRVFSICVMEHLPSDLRRKVMGQTRRVLKKDGMAALTFDYDGNRDTPGLDRGIRYRMRDRVLDDLVRPSGMEVYGNQQLVDDCSGQSFLGSLFFVKT